MDGVLATVICLHRSSAQTLSMEAHFYRFAISGLVADSSKIISSFFFNSGFLAADFKLQSAAIDLMLDDSFYNTSIVDKVLDGAAVYQVLQTE